MLFLPLVAWLCVLRKDLGHTQLYFKLVGNVAALYPACRNLYKYVLGLVFIICIG